MTTEQDPVQPKDLEQDSPKKESDTSQSAKETTSRSKRVTPKKTAAKKTVRKKRPPVKTPSLAVKNDSKDEVEATPDQAAKPKKSTPTKRATGKKKPTKTTKVAPETVPEATAKPKPEVTPLPRLHERFRNDLAPQLMKEFSYSSTMQIPVLEKIAVNIGLGEALENSRAIENATGDLAAITGQQPVVRRARKSIASFKLREGQAIGLSVTLRGRRMYEFLDRLISSSLPRIRDFNGLSRKAFDGRGNYSIGLREQIIFPEIDYNSVDRIRGLQIVIVTTARTDHEGFRLLELLGIPFARTGNDIRAA